jgi:methionyl-tRNA formyltransferase
MYRTRIVLFGTRGQELTSCHLEMFVKHGANLVGLVEAPPGSMSTTHKVKDPYEGIHEVAARLKLPLLCPKNPKEPSFIRAVRDLRPDAIVVNCYQFYLTKELLDIPPLGAINFHASFLPRHAGMHPLFWAVWYGDRETGMVVHYLDEGIDTGDIIYETRVPILAGDTVNELYHRIFETSRPLVKPLLDGLDARSLPRKPQDPAKYLYNYEIEERDYELDFRQPAEVLRGRVAMMPGRFTFALGGRRYGVTKCAAVDEPVRTRRFRTGVPYDMDGRLTFVTPRKFFRVDEVVEGGRVFDPISLLQE